jgi:hypothetical protein
VKDFSALLDMFQTQGGFKPKAYKSKGPPLQGVCYAETQHSKDQCGQRLGSRE